MKHKQVCTVSQDAVMLASGLNDMFTNIKAKNAKDQIARFNIPTEVTTTASTGIYSDQTGELRENALGDSATSGFNQYYLGKYGGQSFDVGSSINEDNIQDLDADTIAKLIAAGADIEIL